MSLVTLILNTVVAVRLLIYGLFAAALLISQLVMGKPLIQRMLGKEITLPQSVWSRLNVAWAIFFIVCGALNIYVAFWPHTKRVG